MCKRKKKTTKRRRRSGGVMRAQGAALVVAVACIAGTMLLSTGLRCVLPESAAACAPSALVAALDADERPAAERRRAELDEVVAPSRLIRGHVLAAQAMPVPLDKEIAADIALLRAQQKIVNDAEAKLASAYGSKPLAPRGRARLQAAQARGAPTGKLTMPPSDDDIAGNPRPEAKPWAEGASPEHGYEVARFASTNGPSDLAEVDGEKIADWNEFFDNMNARVDAPRWGKENMIIDNIDDIEPCRVDCDKYGGSTGEDFGFFDQSLALNVCLPPLASCIQPCRCP